MLKILFQTIEKLKGTEEMRMKNCSHVTEIFSLLADCLI